MKQTFVIAGLLVIAGLALWRPAAAPAPALSEPAALTTARAGADARHARVTAPAAVVYVAGAVTRPGIYRLPLSARVDQAVRLAGGFATGADPAAVNLAARLEDGEEIRVPRIGETFNNQTARRRAVRKSIRKKRIVDLNAADPSALGSLPGIGTPLAQRIIQFRKLNGPFTSLDELADISGMTQRRIDAITPYLVLHEAP